jgi:hypothetical protein
MNNPTVTSGTAYSQTLVGYPFGGSGNYTANCSSQGGVGSVYFAFDGISTTAWCTGGYSYTAVGITPGSSNAYPTGGQYSTTVSATPYYGEWLQLELPTSVILQSYSLSITTVNFGNFGYPYTWIFLGSNDRVNWNMIDNRNTTTYSSWVNQTPSVFTPTPVLTAYQYYRIVITNVTAASGSTGQLPDIASMTINGYNGSSWNADFYADRLGNLLTAPVTGQSLSDWLGGSIGYVATWYDQSGRGNHVSQSTQAVRPTIGTGVITFTGTQWFSNAATTGGFLANGQQKYSYAACFNSANAGTGTVCDTNNVFVTSNRTGRLILIGGNAGFSGEGNDAWNMTPFTAGNQKSVVMIINNENPLNVTTISAGTTNNLGTIGFPYNGTLIPANSTYSSLNLSNDQFGIGRKMSTGGEYFTGTMKSVMVFNTALSASDAAIIDAWQQSI